MTFKHINFEDSPVMRSLERVAKEKGLVKPESISKTASYKNDAKDFTPTDNLIGNILKLCEGLRSQGFHKYADELEVNYLNYKSAQTLYETTKEKGEDLVGAAHPKGSHHLEGVEGDEAVVEDILDQQLKALQVVEKMPTGKLASSVDAIKAVKTVLGQANLPELKRQLTQQLVTVANDIIMQLGSLPNLLEEDGGPDFNVNQANDLIQKMVNELNNVPFKVENYQKVVGFFEQLMQSNGTGNFAHTTNSVADVGIKNWNKRVGPIMNKIRSDLYYKMSMLLRMLISTNKQLNAGTYVGSGKESLIDRLNRLSNSLDYYTNILPTRYNQSGVAAGTKLITNYKAQVNALLNWLNASSEADIDSQKDRAEGRVKQLEDWVQGFADRWHLL